MSVYVVNIKELDEETDVYNFSVAEDETYILNGIVSHNCRCVLAPMVDEMPERPEENIKDFEEWLDN